LAAVVADDRYGTSGSYYSWEGEARGEEAASTILPELFEGNIYPLVN
jgi:hypothetical protein